MSSEKAMAVYEGLRGRYGERPRVARREPMHELISTMLSHRTTQANEAEAFRRMWARYGSWEAIRDADTAELAETIAPSNYPEVKAPRIQETLARIIEERGQASIDFLAEMPTEEALAWLTSFPGVGIKTATLLLLFTFGHPVLPVDTHVHRVSGRVGLIPEKMSANRAHDALLEMLPHDDHILFNFHVNALRHGQQLCKWRTPICERCPITDLCDWYHRNRAT